MSKLNVEEREVLEAYEKGKLKRSKNAAETQKRHQAYAQAMFRKDARINIRQIFVGYRKERWLKMSRTKR